MAKKRSSRATTRRVRSSVTQMHPSSDDLIQSLAGQSKKVSDEQLAQLFGDQLAELKALARKTRTTRRSRAGVQRTVYLLHGIMGSELGYKRHLLIDWNDVIWLGLSDILMGNLSRLAIGSDSKIEALGFLPGVYLMMRLELEGAGFRVVEFAYDWRQSVATLGARLKQAIEKEKRPVSVVAHSMGGLVTRAAFKQGMKNVDRFIMLATPNHGSLAPVEAMRGQYGLARMISKADFANSSEELARKVFSTFPGLYQMILGAAQHPGADLFQSESWPTNGPQPRPELLKSGSQVQQLLAVPEDTPDVPWYLIAGVSQATKVEARVERQRFLYKVTDEGDGTVPLVSALLPGVKQTWFAAAGHGFFANDGKVRAATVDILFHGDTTAVNVERPKSSLSPTWVAEEDVKNVAETRRRARGGSPIPYHERTRILFGAPESALEAPQRQAEPETSGSGGTCCTHRLEQVTIGRKKQRRLEVQFYRGSITEVDARAYVLGTFSGVTPSGAAGALDQLMEGAINEIIGHNMFGSRTGEVFILPLARREVKAEIGVFVGLGEYDLFKAQPSPANGDANTQTYIHSRHVPALEIAAENAARMLARTHVDEFATVLLGGTIAGDMAATGESMLRGFLRGLEDADHGESVRRIVICELDEQRYCDMRRHLICLATTKLCADIEFVLSDLEPLPEVRRLRALNVHASLAPSTSGPEPAYLLVRTTPQENDPTARKWNFSLLGPSQWAAVRDTPDLKTDAEIDRIMKGVTDATLALESPSMSVVKKLSDDITQFIPADVRANLDEVKNRPLVVLHDAAASRIPWEVLRKPEAADSKKKTPATTVPGMSRRFLASATSCSRWPTAATLDQTIKMLLIVDPLGDLKGAVKEAEAIKNKLQGHKRFKIEHVLRGPAATKAEIEKHIRSGSYDIVHYSGHAFFDSAHRDNCGLICAKEETLTGNDLAGIAKLPFLMVLNACESARVRGLMRKSRGLPAARNSKNQPPPGLNASLAETLLCSGIANLLGTYWPVSDAGAADFATTFYDQLVQEKTLGERLNEARKTIAGISDWANYALYGNPAASLKAE